jgi:hypothetical protein
MSTATNTCVACSLGKCTVRHGNLVSSEMTPLRRARQALTKVQSGVYNPYDLVLIDQYLTMAEGAAK